MSVIAGGGDYVPVKILSRPDAALILRWEEGASCSMSPYRWSVSP